MPLNRRDFLISSAALAGCARKSPSDSLRIGFIGAGHRAKHAHLRLAPLLRSWGVVSAAVCDVHSQRLNAAADFIDNLRAAAGDLGPCQRTTDYRRLLDDPTIDVVCVSTPDHWHAKMTIDALEAGKDVFVEKPMTHTIEEAYAVVAVAERTGRVVQVGVQSTSDPVWDHARARIQEGRIGKVVQAQTHYYRNSSMGQWRYYPLEEAMTPSNIDWPMFLGTKFGLAPHVPFDRARYAQWRCYWDYGGGMFTDLFVHRVTRMMKALGVREPARVVGGGGIFLEYDGREVPDCATLVADFSEGCQLLVTSTMTNDHAIEECVRGHTGTIVFSGKGYDARRGYVMIDQAIKSGPSSPSEGSSERNARLIRVPGKFVADETPAHWRNFIDCVRRRDRDTANPPTLGAAAIALVNTGVASYRDGKALYFDAATRAYRPADGEWARRWETRSAERGSPEHVEGWRAGKQGSELKPESYQRLEGPWIGNKDPATASLEASPELASTEAGAATELPSMVEIPLTPTRGAARRFRDNARTAARRQ